MKSHGRRLNLGVGPRNIMGCHFHIEIFAPQGLLGIEPYLHLCTMELTSKRSGFNGQVIIEGSGLEEVWFEMQPSTLDIMWGSGEIALDVHTAWNMICSFSSMLKASGFRHRISMDDPQGNNTQFIHYLMPAWVQQ